jgi:hypothetical protein
MENKSDKHIYAYRIPDTCFLPHKVISPFYAKVTYTIVGDKVKIEEIGLSPKCLDYIRNTAGVRQGIQFELNAAIKRAINLNNVNRIVAGALAPHVT